MPLFILANLKPLLTLTWGLLQIHIATHPFLSTNGHHQLHGNNSRESEEIQDVVTKTNQHTCWEITSLKCTHS